MQKSLKWVLFFLLCALLPATVCGQTTLVTATILDPNGLPYAGGTLKAVLLDTASGIPAGSPTVTISSQAQCTAARAGTAPCQIPIQGTFQFTLDGTGSIPGGGIVLSDNSLVTPAGTQWLFTVNESPGIPPPAGTGPQTFSVTLTISGASQNITSTLNASAPKLSNASSSILNSFYAQNFGVKADTFSVTDAVCTNGLPQVTSASAHFLSARIVVNQIMWTIAGGGQGNSPPSIAKTTIKSIDSDTQITANTNGNGACGAGQFLVWGDDDFPAFHNNLEPAYYAQVNCATAFLPAGGMMVSGGVLNKPQQPTCNAGQTIAASGMIGAGITGSVFYPTPDFDPTTCIGSGKVNCFGPNNGVRHDFGIEGGGLSATNSPATVFTVLAADSPQNLHDVSCLYWGAGQTNMSGFFTNLSQFFEGPNIEVFNCGAIGPTWGASAIAGPVMGNFLGPTGGTLTVNSAAPGTDWFSNWLGSSGVNECAANTTGFQHVFGLYTATGVEGCVTGGHVTYNGTFTTHNQSIAGRAALKLLTGAVVVANNSSFTDAGTGEFAVSVDATSKFTDSCGNTYTGNINVVAGGIFIPCPTATYPSSTSAPTETGTGACATITTPVGTILWGTLTCTGATGAATIILTPGITSTHGWICFGNDKTTTADLITQSADNATTCTLSAAAIAQNDVIRFWLQQY